MKLPFQHPVLRYTFAHGFTYVELLLAVTISAVLVAGLMGIVNTTLQTGDDVQQRNDLTRQARFAMQRMVRSVSHSPRLLLPLNDNPGTNWPEHIREQTIPASPPIGDSTLATAVLAVTLPHDIDLDDNGIPDADNDGDGLFDEDLGQDRHKDAAPGIHQIDDDGDGSVDEGSVDADDDEDGVSNEDPFDGIDNDGDNSIDEDNPNDMNDDGCPGLCGVDDDRDGNIDEGEVNSDDEQGENNEDWYDSVVFYLNTGLLIERQPVPWDTNADTLVDGKDYIESTVAEYVTRFRVERINTSGLQPSIDLILELTRPESGDTISLQTRVRVGGAL